MNYIDCKNCSYNLSEDPNFDWAKYPCRRCLNTRKVPDLTDALCNLCGDKLCHKIQTLYGLWEALEPSGLLQAEVVGGYGSYHLFDSTHYTFSLCEKCLRNLFYQFKIKPNLSSIFYKELLYEVDQEDYEYRIWKDAGYHHQAYLNKYCNVIKNCPNKAIYTVLCYNENFSENSSCEEHKSPFGNLRHVPFISNDLKNFI